MYPKYSKKINAGLQPPIHQVSSSSASLTPRHGSINTPTVIYPPNQQKFCAEFNLLFNEPFLLPLLYGYYREEPKIGQYCEGGVIFYVDNLNKRALVCAIRDIGKYEWGELEVRTNAIAADLFTGLENTRKLCRFAMCKAAQAAMAYQEKGYTDWYLPSIEELKEIYKQRKIINQGSLQQGGSLLEEFKGMFRYYWSSSESNQYEAFQVNFYGGHSNKFSKAKLRSVRPIRTFNY